MKIDNNLFIFIDRLIREGQHAQASRTLDEILQSEIPREFFYQVAAVSRRLSRSEIGVKLLNPIVRPPATKVIVSTDAERAEYAGCLIRLGIFKEAHAVLDTVNPEVFPRSLLFRAFAYIARWDFEKSKKYLEDFMNTKNKDFYEVLIAKVNLSVGLVFLEEYENASLLLSELCEVTLETKNMLLYANSLELAAQSAILGGHYADADNYLSAAMKALTSSETIDAFYLKKDQAILNLFRSKNGKKEIQHLMKIKEEARSRKFWEQGRDCDYYLAIATKNTKIINHLYFGTPYESYRNKLATKLNLKKNDFPKFYSWELSSKLEKNESKLRAVQFNILNGENNKNDDFLNEEQVPQRLLQSLASDFYRPRRLMEIFEALFPNEYFMPKYSADKTHQAFKRLRSELKRLEIPLVINENSGFYHLSSESGFKVEILCPQDKSPQQKNIKNFLIRRQDKQVRALLRKIKKKEFTATDFARWNKISARTSVRHLKSAFEKGWLERKGKARFVRYKLK